MCQSIKRNYKTISRDYCTTLRDYCTTSFNKAWTQVLRRWGSLTMIPTGNKDKRCSSVNHITKTIHHHHHHHHHHHQTGVFLQNFGIFQGRLFYRTPPMAASTDDIGTVWVKNKTHISVKKCLERVYFSKRVYFRNTCLAMAARL